MEKISENIFKIEKKGKMNVPGIIFSSDKLFEKIKRDKTLEQVKNVAQLQGIVEKSIALPDAHQGYGFCVGGVAAFDLEKGIISPGGIGYDINCGVRLLIIQIKKQEFLKKREKILDEIYKEIPSGVGKSSDLILTEKDLDGVLENGVNWALEKNLATKEDILLIEDNGKIENASAKKISQRAKARGRKQLGTLGAGNHFLEILEVQEIFDKNVSKTFNLEESQTVILIHTGSRGLGHQTASDYIKKMENVYGTSHLPDRELACAPINSELGKDYLQAMAAAANFAFTNRQIITHKIRKIFKENLNTETKILYDVAHNIAKFEEFKINGKTKTLCVHRKGATRSLGKNRKELPEKYKKVGSPILIPGSMGTSSYVLVGTEKARELSFASTAHGAGRLLSRTSAKKDLSLNKVKSNLKERDILIRAGSEKGILEEAPEAYKDVDEVVKISHEVGIGNLVAKLKPLGVLKG